MNASNPFLDAALSYAARGVPVFPCSPVNKRPLTPAESASGAKDGGLYLATTDEAQIRELWRRFPKALIGARTGPSSKTFVVDLDPREHDVSAMHEALTEWCGGFDGRFDPETGEVGEPPIVRTQSGGFHLWYAYPKLPEGEKLGNRTNLFSKVEEVPEAIVRHVDVRGEGGYVILPPSQMENGNRYEWARKGTGFPQAPARLLDLILRREPFHTAPSPAPSTGGTALPPIDDAVEEARRKYALSALERETRDVAGCPEGVRNDKLNRAAFALGTLVGAGVLSESMAQSGLEDAGVRCGLARADGLKSVQDTIRSGLEGGKRQPRDLSSIEQEARERAERKSRRGSAPRQAARLAPPDSENPPPAPAARVPSQGVPLSPVASGELMKTGEMARSEAQGGRGGRNLDVELAFLPLTDLGNAARFLRRFGERFVHCPDWGWLMWDGKRWNRDGATGRVDDAVKEAIRLIVGEAVALRESSADEIAEYKRGEPVMLSDKVEAWALTSQAAGHVKCIESLIRSDLEKPVSAFDADKEKINVANGTLFIRRNHNGGLPTEGDYIGFKPHDRTDLITKLAPVDYDPKAPATAYDDFLAFVQPDPNVRRFLHQWGGLSFTGDVGEQKLSFFYGKGKNGKSTLVDAWAHVAGDYGETVPIETFLDQGRGRNAGAATPDLAILPGVRFLRTSEPEKGAKLAEALIKLATGGEAIQARHLNKDYFKFYPQFKLTISGNYRPKIDGTDDGIWRRMMLIPWGVTVPEERRDKHLIDKLKREGSGILNRILDGLREWLDTGLMVPEKVVEATETYRSDSDPLGRFLDVCTASAMGQRVQSSELYRLFCAWAKVNGEREWSSTGFGRALRDRGLTSKQSNVIWWLDLKLTKSESDFIDWEGNPIRSRDDDE